MLIKKILCSLVLFSSIQIDACEICQYIKEKSITNTLKMHDKILAGEIDENYWIMIGEMFIIKEMRDKHLLHP